MSKLNEAINSRYIEAANRMRPKNARRRIVAYVESYDDVFFWRTVLNAMEDKERYFEVMLPTRSRLARGKKSALMALVEGNHMGRDMIACVDADYDYLLQGVTATSKLILENPYVFHSYVYAIENYQCYAESLHQVCVMITLNDHAVFDFERFFKTYSEIIYPLFVWSIWMYRKGWHGEFSLSDFCQVVETGRFDISHPQGVLEHLRRKVKRKMETLKKRFPKGEEEWQATSDDLRLLGVKPEETYLYIQGHHLSDTVVVPLLTKVCNRLRLEREDEIHRTAVHRTQMYNELSCYENSISDIRTSLKRNTGYMGCEQFKLLQEDIRNYLDAQ